MSNTNIHTKIRLRQVKLRALANLLGTVAMRSIDRWPIGGTDGGAGRAVKAGSERIYRILEGTAQLSHPNMMLPTFANAMRELALIRSNTFFISDLIKSPVKVENQRYVLGDLVDDELSELHELVDLELPQLISDQATAKTIEDLRITVPPQKVGPIVFIIDDDMLKIQHSASRAGQPNIKNARSARDSIISRGQMLLDELLSSNHDKRVAAAISSMQNKLIEDVDIIQLGLENTYCDMLCDAYAGELSVIALAAMRAYSIGISQYLAQFPDWVRFTENAASIELTEHDRKEIHRSGQNLLNELSKPNRLIDPEVPKSIKLVLEAYGDGKKASKRTAFAVIRTIENFVSSIVGIFGDSIQGAKRLSRNGGVMIVDDRAPV
ncbi:hypothetical protein [Sphingomonas psychrolutea]|nr:hypothetical protein [Sphingomonas psychrolutea]